MTSPGADRRVRWVISVETAQAIQNMRQLADATGNIGRAAQDAQKKGSSFGDALKTGLGVVGVQAGLDGLVGGLKSVTQGGLDYEKSLNTMSAVSGATSEQMAQIADTARKLGSDVTIPGASAQTAAAAMTELAKGGLTAQQAMEASRGTMILAAAAQIDGAQAAEIQANALNTFGLKADEAGRVANVLANVANQSSGEIGDFAQGLAQAGTIASSFGWSIEDTTNYLGLMANAGIKGSDAGTSLKTTMTALLNPTKQQAAALAELGIQTQDSNGNMISARDLADQLSAARGRMSDAEFNAAAATAFGTDAVRTALVAADAGTEGYDKMAGALGNVTGAQDVAAANSKGLSGMVDQLRNTVDEASLSLFEALTPAMQELTPAITSVVTPLSDGLAPLLGIVADTATGTLAPALEAAAGLIGALADPLADVVGFLNGLPGPMGAAALAVAGLVLYRGPISTLWSNMTTGLTNTRAQVATFTGSMRAATGVMASTQVAAKGLMGALGGPLGLTIVGVTTALSFMGGAQEDVTVQTSGLSAAIDEQTGAFKENADAIIKKAAADGGSFDAYERLGGTVTEYTNALMQNEDAQEAVHTRLLDTATRAVEASDGYARMIEKGQELPGSARRIASELLASGDAGLYSSDALNAVIESSKRYASDTQQITDAQRHQRQGTEGATAAAKANADAMGGMKNATVDATGAVEGAAGASTTAAESFKAHADMLKAATEQAKFFAEQTPLSSYLAGVKTAADDANRSMDYFKALQDELTGKTRSLNDAVSAQNGALASVAASFEAGTKAATENTEAGNLNVEALRNWDVNALTATSDGRSMYDQLTRLADQHVNTANAAYQDAIQHGNVAGAADVARAAADQNRAKFLELAAQYGITGGDAEALADKLGIVAGAKIEDKDFKIIADDKAAQDALRAAQNAEIADKTFRITALANVDQVALDAANAKADQFFAGTKNDRAATDYAAIKAGTAESKNAAGGYITGPGSGTSDSIPARLSNGEFVVTAAATARNRSLLEAINSGAPGFAEGGLVGAEGSDAGSSGGSLAEAAGAMQVSAQVPVPDVTAALAAWQQLADGVSTTWATVTATIASAQTAITASQLAIDASTTTTGAMQRALLDTQVTPVWSSVVGTIGGAQTAVQGSYSALNGGTDAVGTSQRFLLDAQVTPVWDAVTGKVATSWASLSGTYAALNAGTDEVGRRQSALRSTTDTEWASIGSRIHSTQSQQIAPAWQQVRDFADATGSFFSGINAGVSDATTQVVGDIGTIRDELQKFFDMVDGRTTGGGSGASAQVTVSTTQALADGGLITSGTGPRTDDVLVRASKGEYVVNAAATSRNKDLLDQINYGGAYADGGLISDSVARPLKDVLVTGTATAVSSGVEKAVTALTPTFSGAFNGAVPEGARGAFLNAILSKQGTSYVWGAAGPDVFDCSGLMSWGLQQAGVGKGRLTAAQFGDSFPRANPEKPGDMAIFDTGRVSPKAGHIGAVLDPTAGTMMHTDGAGPARISPYRSRSGLMGFIDAIGGSYVPAVNKTEAAAGDPPAANWVQSTIDRIKSGSTALTSMAGNIAYSSTAGVEQWRGTVLQALQILNEPAAYAENVLNQIRTESSGNPNAINNWDSNAAKGTPSKGLVQVIDPTFRSYAVPPYNTNIWDPLSNILAGANYARHEYGSIAAGMRGVAYDAGGPLKPGYTLAYNGTGGDEMTLTQRQWATASQAINQAAAGGAGGTVNLNVSFSGDGPLTNAMVKTATVSIDNALAEVARLTTIAGSQR